MTISRKLRLACLMFVLVCTVGCDQTSKHIARVGLSQVGSFALLGGFVELSLAENPGSFLSFGALLPNLARFTVFTLGVGVGLVALAAYLVLRVRLDLWRFIGLSLVLAGGLSNLLDRLVRDGLVTDFIVIRVGSFHTGVFNAADVLIMMGIGIIIYALRKTTSPDSPPSQMPPTLR
jgi:signal peptidase II